MIIINADDFGLDKDTNWAIIEAFNKGLCSSTTIMANGNAFDEAVELIWKHNLQNKIGLHINLTQLSPITKEMKKNTLFCTPEGDFQKDWKIKYKNGINLDKITRQVVANEIIEQLDRCFSSGIKITHFDSHHHIHTVPGISGIIWEIAKQFNIKAIRISRNCGLYNVPFYKKLYKYYYKFRLKQLGFKVTDYFGSAEDLIACQNQIGYRLKDKNTEIMCHPRKRGKDVIDLDGELLENKILKINYYNSSVSYFSLYQ
ncbi:MAG: ChbG/HpnK family deacetylase [Desulfosporosinus sp.]|nr:ChbG/HpnK family deacetylase [Desulfosporosinus sp.]